MCNHTQLGQLAFYINKKRMDQMHIYLNLLESSLKFDAGINTVEACWLVGRRKVKYKNFIYFVNEFEER